MSGPAVLVLGAGLGKRMGQPKLLLPWQGITLMERILARCREARAVVTLTVSPKLRAKVQARAAALPPPPPRLVAVAGELPMLASVQAGLAAGGFSGGFWLWPVDAPFLSAGGWRRLRAGMAAAPEAIWKPSAGGATGHPVWFPGWSVAEILAGDWPDGLLGFLEAHRERIRVLPLAGEELRDFNTPQQLAGARVSQGQEEPP